MKVMETTTAPTAGADHSVQLRGIDRSLSKQEQLFAARRMIGAASRHLGATVSVRGERFIVVAPLAVEQFGHPDSIARMCYGVTGVPGTFRADVSVGQVASLATEPTATWSSRTSITAAVPVRLHENDGSPSTIATRDWGTWSAWTPQ